MERQAASPQATGARTAISQAHRFEAEKGEGEKGRRKGVGSRFSGFAAEKGSGVVWFLDPKTTPTLSLPLDPKTTPDPFLLFRSFSALMAKVAGANAQSADALPRWWKSSRRTQATRLRQTLCFM